MGLYCRIQLVLTDAAPGKNTVFSSGTIANAERRMDFNKERHYGKNEVAATRMRGCTNRFI